MYPGHQADLHWVGGDLTGDEVAAESVKIRAENMALYGLTVGPDGMALDPTRWPVDGLTAWWLIRATFQNVAFLSGEVPEPPDTVEGAVY
jgi:hypothetical protein